MVKLEIILHAAITNCLFLNIIETRSLQRVQRAAIPLRQQATYHPYFLPANNAPLNVPRGYNPALPFNPFTHGFGMGFELNDGHNFAWDGDLNFPIVDDNGQVYYPFNLDGGFTSGVDNVAVGYGHAVNPTNALDVPIDQVYPCFFGLCNGQQYTQQPVLIPQAPQPTKEPPEGPELASLELDSSEESTTEPTTKAPTKPPTKKPTTKKPAKKTTPKPTTEPTTETTEAETSTDKHYAIKTGDPASESNEILVG